MEGNFQESKINLQFGDDFGEGKCNITVEVNFSKEAATAQEYHLKTISGGGGIDIDKSVVFSFPTLNANTTELENSINNIFSNESKDCFISKSLYEFNSTGQAEFKTQKSDQRVIF